MSRRVRTARGVAQVVFVGAVVAAGAGCSGEGGGSARDAGAGDGGRVDASGRPDGAPAVDAMSGPPVDASAGADASTPVTDAAGAGDARGDARAAGVADVGRETGADAAPTADPWAHGPPLGARRLPDGGLEVRLRAPNATRVELALFGAALGESERLRVPLVREPESDRHTVRLDAAALAGAGLGEPLYYGFRVWGPNWPYTPEWTPGSGAGFVAEIDANGHRMNPNKVVFDPYALELSHDPRGPGHTDYGVFRGDEAHRDLDSGPFAPKGVVIDLPPPAAAGPGRPLRDQIVYEVHLRGLTRADDTLPEAERGTYAGARARARALAALGVTAVEFLPLHETPNDQNELTPDAEGDNYWGYSTLSYFAPDRRYAADRTAGGPTRELRDMVRAFHDEGLEVWVDVVYNHTAEGGGGYLSFRGVDDAVYYEHADDPRAYVNGNGVGPNVATANALVGDLVVDSLRYWHEVLGVDGFRFDLAPIVGNGCARGCFRWAPEGLLTRISQSLARGPDGGPGVALVAEPWALGPGTYRLGEFPAGWSEWNDRFRDTVRRDLNRLGVEAVPLRELVRRVVGSPDLFGDDGRRPAATVNFVNSHDGFTLRDVFAYDTKHNDQAWPWGPSNGGSDHELSWDFDGDEVRQRRAARTAMALLAVSHGVPMIVGGDEFLRTQQGNNNPYNLDSPAIWLAPDGPMQAPVFHAMTTRLFAFRHAHAALRPALFADAREDADGDGQPTLSVYRDDGTWVDDAYLDANDRHFLSWVLDGDERGDPDRALWIAYNGWSRSVQAHPPPAPPGTGWRLVVDTGEAGAPFGHARETADAAVVDAWPYPVESRSLAVFVAR